MKELLGNLLWALGALAGVLLFIWVWSLFIL